MPTICTRHEEGKKRKAKNKQVKIEMDTSSEEVVVPFVVKEKYFQKRWPAIFLSVFGIDINPPKNLLLLWNLIEGAYSKFYIAIIPKGGAFMCHVRLLYPILLL